MRIEAVKVRRLYLEVARQIEQSIRAGEIAPGKRLPSERDLAASFGVSRPTIREAMIALEIAGLVEIRTGSGIYVLEPLVQTQPQIADAGPGPFEVLKARLLIEAETAALAAQHVTPAQLEALAQALADMEQSAARVGAEESMEAADRRFHCLIAEASENSALASSVSWLWALRNRSELSQLFHRRVREEGIHPSLEEHRCIYSAIAARDAQGARQAMETHLHNALEADLALLNRQDS